MTVEGVVDALGRHFRTDPVVNPRTVVASRYGVTYKAVGNWCSWNAFPQRIHLRIARDCEAAGIDLPAGFFDPVDQSPGQAFGGAKPMSARTLEAVDGARAARADQRHQVEDARTGSAAVRATSRDVRREVDDSKRAVGKLRAAKE